MLRLSFVDVRLAPWLVAVLAIVIPLGPILMVTLQATDRVSMFGPARRLPGPVESWIVVGFLLVALTVLIWRRRWFLTKSTRWQWTRAAFICLLMSALFLFVWNYRSNSLSWLVWSFFA